MITDRTGAVRFDMKNRVQGPPQTGQQGQGTAGRTRTQGRTQTAARGQQSAQTPPSGQGAAGGDAKCPICGGPITKAEQDYSLRKYGREACRACQKAL